MVRIIFDGTKVRLSGIGGPSLSGKGYADFEGSTSRQVGAGPIAYFEGLPPQRGYGMATMTLARQRGSGVGSMLRKLWKYLRPLATSAKPIAFSAARSIGKEGLETGARILNEVTRGGDIGEAVASHGEAGLRRLVGKAQTKLQKRKEPIGEEQQGEGRRRKKRIKKRRKGSSSAISSGRTRRKSVHWQIGQGRGRRKSDAWSAEAGAKRRGRKRKASEREFLLRPSDVIGKTVMQKALLKRRRLDNLGY